MDFLNKALGQLNELFRSMTIGARITAALLFAVVVMSLVWLFRYQSSSADFYLMNGVPLTSYDVMNMETAFAEAGLKGSVVEGNRIRVPRGQKDLYLAAAAEHKALPRGFGGYLDDALNQGNVMESSDQRAERIKNAKQKELAQIIGRMHGIEAASVLLDADSKQRLVRETTKTALVSVKPVGSTNLSETQVDSIRHLVVGAVADLKVGNVKVVDENSGIAYYGETGGAAGGLDNPYYAAKRLAEQHWQGQILRALAYVPGIQVAVNVDPEKQLSSRKTELKPEQKGVVRQRKETTSTKSRDAAAPGGRAGFEANGRQAIAQTTGKGSHEEEESSTSTEDSFIGSTSTESVSPGLTPARVTASIAVPASYFEDVWRKRNPAQPGEEPKKPTQADLDQVRTEKIASIKSHVAALLPQPSTTTDKPADLTQQVTVTEFQDIPPAPTPAPGLPDRTLDWLVNNWSMLGLIFLGGLSLVVLRSVARSAPASSSRSPSRPFSLDLSSIGQKMPEPQPELVAAATAATPATEAPEERRSRRPAVGRSLRDELSELVADDPDAAAGILRTWIGNI